MSPTLEATTDNSENEIDRVANALRAMEAVSFDESCALRVSVGQGDDKGFPLLALQKLSSLLLAGAEELLELLHPDHRVLSNDSCRSIRSSSAVVLEGGSRTPKQSFDGEDWFDCCVRGGGGDGDASATGKIPETELRALWQAETLAEFCLLVGPGENDKIDMAYRFWDLVAPLPISKHEKGIRRTIEFRQADGNLRCDQRYILSWVDVALSLVAFAVEADQDEFERAIKGIRRCLLGLEEVSQVGMFGAAVIRSRVAREFLGILSVPRGSATAISGRAVTCR